MLEVPEVPVVVGPLDDAVRSVRLGVLVLVPRVLEPSRSESTVFC